MANIHSKPITGFTLLLIAAGALLAGCLPDRSNVTPGDHHLLMDFTSLSDSASFPLGKYAAGSLPPLIVIASADEITTPAPGVEFTPAMLEQLHKVDFSQAFVVLHQVGRIKDNARITRILRSDHQMQILVDSYSAGPGNYELPGWSTPYRVTLVSKGDQDWNGEFTFTVGVDGGDAIYPPLKKNLSKPAAFILSSTPVQVPQATPDPYPLPQLQAYPSPYPSPEIVASPYPLPVASPASAPSPMPTLPPTPIPQANIIATVQPQVSILAHPIPGGDMDVSFSDAQHGWLVAYPGENRDPRTGAASLYVTRDGGQTWNWLSNTDVIAPDFVSPQAGWARRGDGLARTNDGGLTWRDLPAPAGWQVDSFDFASQPRGWWVLGPKLGKQTPAPDASGIRLQRTTDGGRTWEELALPCEKAIGGVPAYFGRIALHLVGRQDAWLVCGGQPITSYSGNWKDIENLKFGWLYHSQDDGRTWQVAMQASLHELVFDEFFRWSEVISLSFADERTGWVGTGGTGLRRTEDGGQTWSDTPLPYFDNTPFRDLIVFSPLHGLAAWTNTFSSVLAETRDGGETWQPIFPPILPAQVQFFDLQNGIGLGIYPWQNNQFFRTADGGRTWQPLGQAGKASAICRTPYAGEHDCVFAIHSFDFADPENGWALSNEDRTGRLFATHDGGRTWAELPPPPDYAYNVSLFTPGDGYLVAIQGPLYGSHDAGKSFTALAATPGGNLLDFSTPQDGLLAEGDTLHLTGDGGRTWQSQRFDGRIVDLKLLPGGEIWLLGVEFGPNGREEGVFLWYSPDHGREWTGFDFGKDDPRFYPTFDFLDAQHGWVRTSDHLYSTTDGGYTWEMVR